MHQLERVGGTDAYTRLLSVGTARLAPIGRVEAQVALGGFLEIRIPHGAVRPLGTKLDAALAANTFLLIDHPDIAVFRVHMRGAGRTMLHAQRRDALPARIHHNVERIVGEGGSILHNLNAGQGGVSFPLMSHGTGVHTALTAKAHPAVVDDITRRGGVGDLALRRGGQVRDRGGECLGGGKTCHKSTGGNGRAATGQKVAS